MLNMKKKGLAQFCSLRFGQETGAHEGAAQVMTTKQEVKTVEIFTDLHGLEFLNNVITGEETWIF